MEKSEFFEKSQNHFLKSKKKYLSAGFSEKQDKILNLKFRFFRVKTEFSEEIENSKMNVSSIRLKSEL